MPSSLRFPLGRLERKLYQRVQARLPTDEQVLAAIIVILGPRPGAEAFLGGLGGFGAVVASRDYYTIAVTDRGVVQFENGWPSRPKTLIVRAALSDFGELNDTVGDNFVEFRGDVYWMGGVWSPELFKIRRLITASKHPTKPGSCD